MIVQRDESSSAAWKWPVTVQKRCQQAGRSRRAVQQRRRRGRRSFVVVCDARAASELSPIAVVSASRPCLPMKMYIWLSVSQRVVFKTALMVWKCVHGLSSLSQRPLRTRYCHLRSSASAICSNWYSTGSTRPDCNWTTSQRTSHMEPALRSPDLSECAFKRHWRRTCPWLPGATETSSWFWRRYKYSDLLTYLLTYFLTNVSWVRPIRLLFSEKNNITMYNN